MAGFFNIPGVRMPFGMSNQSNPSTVTTGASAPAPAPGFPSSQQLQQQNPGANPNNQNLNTGNTDPNNNPNNNPDPNKGKDPDSQLDSFKDIFKLPVDAQGKPLESSDPMARPITNFDAKKFQEATKNMNFAAGITPEQLSKAMQDPQALLDALNTVARNGFNAAMSLNVSAMETGFSNFRNNLDEGLPSRVRSLQIKQQAPKHPALNHPAAAPVVEAMKSSIATANPTLPPERIAEMAENYFIAMATDISNVNTQRTNADKKPGPSEINWQEFLSS